MVRRACSNAHILLSKREENNIKMIREAFEGEKKLVGEPEKLAYAIVLYLAFNRLKQLKFISSDPGDPRSCLHELIEMNPFRRIYVSDLLTSYLLEFKKFCEATFKPEG